RLKALKSPGVLTIVPTRTLFRNTSSDGMASAVRAAIIVALRLRAEGRAIVLSLWVQERFDGGHHRLGNEHHFQTERSRNVDQGCGARRRRPGFNIAVARTRYAGQIGHLLLGQSGGQSGAAKMVADQP